MTRAPDRRSRLVVLLLAASLVTGLAATVSVSAAGTLPSCKVADTLTKFRSYTDWNRSLLDSTYRLTSTYKPSDLRSTSYAGLNSGFSVRRLVIADLSAMAAAARRAGARFVVQSAFRSYATQKATFDYWVRVHGYAVALKESARAGHSEHQLGTALDFRSYGGSAPWNYADWATTRAGAWLKNNAWRYGFVMSYPKGKTALTCYTYEPWHYRYVGRTRAAKIRASGVTLREFLWREQNPVMATPIPTPSPTPTLAPTPEPTPVPTPEPTPQPTPTPT
jgi:D-alanyl-D-alanine carboxypeptidase